MSGQSHQTPTPEKTPAPATTPPGPAHDQVPQSNAATIEAMDGAVALDEEPWWIAALAAPAGAIAAADDAWNDVGARKDYDAAVVAIEEAEPRTATVEGAGPAVTVQSRDSGLDVAIVEDAGDSRSERNLGFSDDGTTSTSRDASADKTLDREATAKAIQERLTARADAIDVQADIAATQHGAAQKALDAIEAERATRREADPDRSHDDLDAWEAEVRSEMQRLDQVKSDKSAASQAVRAESAATTPDNVENQLLKVPGLTGVDGQAGAPIEPTYKVDSSSSLETKHTDSGPSVQVDLDTGEVKVDPKVTRSSESTIEVTEDGTTTTDTRKDSAELDLLEGSLEEKVTTGSAVKHEDGSGTSEERTDSSGVALDEGVKANRSRTETRVKTNADGSSQESSETVEGSGGLVVREGEVGIGGKGSMGFSEKTRDSAAPDASGTDQSAKLEASGELTNKGAKGSAGVSSKGRSGTDANHVKANMGWQAFGGFTLDIAEAGGGLYSVVCTVTAGIKGNAGAGGKATQQADSGVSGGASGEVHGEASMGVTYKRLLTEQELATYVDDARTLEASQRTGSNKPEFKTVANWYAGLDALGDGGAQALTAGVGPDAASSLKPGESVAVVVTTKAGGSGEVSLGPVSAKGGMDVAFQRAVTVAPVSVDGARRVDVTIKVVDSSSADGGLGVQPGVAKGSVDVGSKSSDSQSVTFRLDPEASDYNGDYQSILDADSLSELTGLAERLEKKVHSRALGASDSSSHGAGLEVGGAGATVGYENAESETVEIDESGLHGEFSGSEKAEGSLVVGGVEVVGSSNTAGVDATVDTDGDTTMRFDETQTDSGLGNGTGEMGAHDVLQAPKDMLAKMLASEWTVLSRFELNEAEVRALYARVDPHGTWGNAVQHFPQKLVQPWEDLRDAIKNPRPDPEWVKADPDVANDLARARAMSHFMAQTGTHGRQTVLNLLRESDTNSDIGLMTQWPPGIADKKGDFYGVMSRRDALGDVMSEFVLADDLSGALSHLDTLQQDTQTVRDAIDTCTEFTESRSKGEMLDEMDKVLADIGAERISLGMATGAAPATEDDLLAAHIDPKLRTLASYKKEEEALTREIETWSTSWWAERDDDAIMEQCIRLTKQWRIVIFDIRELYETHGISAGMRDISSNTSATRSEVYEPSWDRVIEIYAEFNGPWAQGSIDGLKKLLEY